MGQAAKERHVDETPLKVPEWLTPLDDPRAMKLLGAAYRVFIEKGFHRATMLDIASAARASKETLYAHFGSKEKLLEALLAWSVSNNRPRLSALAEAPVERAEEALRDAAVGLLTFFYRPEVLAMDRLRVAEGALRPELGRIADEVAVRPIRDALGAYFGRLVRAGVIPMNEVHAAAESFVDVLRGVLYQRVLSGAEPPPDAARIRDIAARAARVALRAFAPV